MSKSMLPDLLVNSWYEWIGSLKPSSSSCMKDSLKYLKLDKCGV